MIRAIRNAIAVVLDVLDDAGDIARAVAPALVVFGASIAGLGGGLIVFGVVFARCA